MDCNSQFFALWLFLGLSQREASAVEEKQRSEHLMPSIPPGLAVIPAVPVQSRLLLSNATFLTPVLMGSDNTLPSSCPLWA